MGVSVRQVSHSPLYHLAQLEFDFNNSQADGFYDAGDETKSTPPESNTSESEISQTEE